MKILRRKLIIKLVLCLLYIIVVLVITKQIFCATHDYPLAQVKNLEEASVKSEDPSDMKDLDKEKFAINREYEKWILRYKQNIVPGLGENGEPAYLYGEERIKADKILAVKASNIILSNKISLMRNLPDVRDPLCANVTYDKVLPTASVVIIFYNEPWSVLLRTVHSVLRRSPPHLLKEIILVDDYSDEEELLGILEYYIETRLPKKVKLLRLNQRKGLIRARLRGAEHSSGDVLVFLDAHCEVTKDWLLPLLQRIKEKHNAVVAPIIDNISEETLEYLHDNEASFFQVGGFTWAGHFTWINIQEQDSKVRVSPISPVRSPTMAGGLFAINRKYFWEIGSYDNKMDGWGGENLEMSFRIWQCGGVLEIIPCSRVGHIFRNFHPYKFPNDKDTHAINTARLAFVWMDEYRRLFLLHRSEFKENPNLIGDITERLLLRAKLKCKSFKWYLKNVYPEKFIPDENVIAYGRVKLRNKYLCLDNLQHEDDKPYNLGVYSCHSKIYPSQFFSLSNEGELRQDETCAAVVGNDSSNKSRKVEMSDCSHQKQAHKWVLSKDGKLIHVESGLCLDGSDLQSGEEIQGNNCNDVHDQYWQFDFYKKKKRHR